MLLFQYSLYSCFRHRDTLAVFHRILPNISCSSVHSTSRSCHFSGFVCDRPLRSAEIGPSKPFSEDGIGKNTVPVPCIYNFLSFKTLFYPGNVAGWSQPWSAERIKCLCEFSCPGSFSNSQSCSILYTAIICSNDKNVVVIFTISGSHNPVTIA